MQSYYSLFILRSRFAQVMLWGYQAAISLRISQIKIMPSLCSNRKRTKSKTAAATLLAIYNNLEY